MKDKHVKMWVSVCMDIAKVSNCPRGKFAALIIDEESNTLVASGYNGYLRGGAPLCGGEDCGRDAKGIESGKNIEIGCIHAEMNALVNCARETVSSQRKIMFVNGEPCVMCAKLIVQAGI
ncbi:MAG: cytidine deaminase, partial [Thermoplasmata archaeon]|nr:cytidine deaminase [Thermoplasmata archaeon]